MAIDYVRLNGTEEIPWNEIHDAGDRGMLTGTAGFRVMAFHQLKKSDFRNAEILDIGVGFGNFARHLQQCRAKRIVCVDIVPEAARRLPNGVEFCLTENLPIDNPVDGAVCHLVIQHCNDELARQTLRGIHQSLKPGGWLSVQMGGAIGPVPGDRGDVVWRTKEECELLLQEAGFNMGRYRLVEKFTPIMWHIFWVTTPC